MTFTAIVRILLKPEVPDPAAKDLLRKAHALDIVIDEARIGKLFEINMSSTSESDVRDRVRQMCEKLLANQYIEQYEIVSVHAD